MEKRGKEIILLALALVLIAVTAFTLIPRKAKAPQAVAAVNITDTDQDKTAGDETKTAENGNKTNMPAPGELLGAPSGASPNRNPFASPASAATPVASASMPAATRSPSTPAARAAAATGTGNLPPFFPQNPAAAMGAPPVEVLQFTGILQGNEPMAVVRRGESRYFVTVGDYVDNYRVTAIGSDRIALKSKEGKQIILHLGGGA